MSSVDSKLYQYAVATAKQAVKYDNQGKYRQAINMYNRAAEILMRLLGTRVISRALKCSSVGF